MIYYCQLFQITIKKIQKQRSYISLEKNRQKQTYFFTFTSWEGIDAIKRKLLTFFKGLQSGDIRLYFGQKLLDDKSNLHDQGINNNTLIHFKLKKGNTGQWQQIPQLGL